MPSVSVIVPVYQAEEFLNACVASVTAQTFSDWELLLVDDGCTDASPALCDACAAADSRVRVIHKQQNAGVSEARNTGLREAQGTCIAFLDADDRLEPTALETLWRLREESGADTAGCSLKTARAAAVLVEYLSASEFEDGTADTWRAGLSGDAQERLALNWPGILAEAQAICADPAACADELASAGVETDFPGMELGGVPDKLTALDAVLCAQGQPVK